MNNNINNIDKKLIWVDESGSYNDFGYGIFVVSIVVVKKENYKKLKRLVNKFFKKHNLKFKLKEEIKAHSLKEKGLTPEIINFWKSIQNLITYSCSYVKNIKDLKVMESNVMYNWLLKNSLERAIDQDIIKISNDLIILADSRPIEAYNQRWGTEKYLKNTTDFNIKSFKFINSENSIEIFIADLNSFVLNRWILNYNNFRDYVFVNKYRIRYCDQTKIKIK